MESRRHKSSAYLQLVAGKRAALGAGRLEHFTLRKPEGCAVRCQVPGGHSEEACWTVRRNSLSAFSRMSNALGGRTLGRRAGFFSLPGRTRLATDIVAAIAPNDVLAPQQPCLRKLGGNKILACLVQIKWFFLITRFAKTS